MKFWYMCECPYPHVPAEIVAEAGTARASLPNRYCDPQIAARLLDECLDEFLLCDALGLNLVVNEHHAGINCLFGANPVILGALARQTSRARLLSLGTLITVRPDPVRVAEEYATIDVLSRGRLEIGFVKSGGSEMASGNANPIGIEERFWEAIDLITRTLTAHDGPFRWEGRHFAHRHVNIWPRAWQTPHPPFWAATADQATARELARRGIINAVFPNGPARARATWAAYREGAVEAGLPPPAPDRFAYLAFTAVGETDAQGWAVAEKLLWFLEVGDLCAPQFATFLPGAVPPERAPQIWRGRAPKTWTVEEAVARGMMFAGSPDTVARQIAAFRAGAGDFGHLILMGRSGFMTHAETERSIRLFACEVMPRLDGAHAGSPGFPGGKSGDFSPLARKAR